MKQRVYIIKIDYKNPILLIDNRPIIYQTDNLNKGLKEDRINYEKEYMLKGSIAGAWSRQSFILIDKYGSKENFEKAARENAEFGEPEYKTLKSFKSENEISAWLNIVN